MDFGWGEAVNPSKPGTCEIQRQIVATALLDLGRTMLECRIGAEIAAMGKHDWRSDRTFQHILRRPNDGRHYHVRSIARARRRLAHDGLIFSQRCEPNVRPMGCKKFFYHPGTTNKAIRWPALRATNPLDRHVNRSDRRRLKRAVEQLVLQAPPEHAHIAVRTRSESRKLEPIFSAMVSGVFEHRSSSSSSGSAPLAASLPSQADFEQHAADARARFAEWRKAHPEGEPEAAEKPPDETGPPD
jgi:hypothetical protein